MSDLLAGVETFIGRASTKATESAAEAAAQAAVVQYERYKPWLALLAVLIGTIYVFFFVPRFVLPWRAVK